MTSIRYDKFNNNLLSRKMAYSSKYIPFLRNQQFSDVISLYNHFHPYHSDEPNTDQDKLKIVAYTPPLDMECGGNIVIHNITKTINRLKYKNIIAKIYSYDHQPYENDFCTDFYNPHHMDDNTIVIYPETISGNPLNAKHVIRWILLDLGIEMPSHQYKSWNKSDLVYHWEPHDNKYSKQLVNLWLNPHIHNKKLKNRDKRCYLLKKILDCPGKMHKNLLTPYHMNKDISLDKLSTKQIIEIFNHSEIFYCYDPNTFYSIMAPLCGCITVLHPLNNMSREEYFSKRILNKYDGSGIAYGNSLSEISRALETVHNAPQAYNKLIQGYQDSLSDTLSELHNYIYNNSQLTNTVENIYYQ